MTLSLPWILVFLLFFFIGVFFMIYYAIRLQEKNSLLLTQQLKAARMEIQRLADAMDSLLAEHELNDDAVLAAKPEAAEARSAKPAPGLDRLLLGEEGDPHDSDDEDGKAAGSALPDLKL